MKKDVLIIYSGGMDSTVLLHKFKDRIGLAVTFNYGSKHNAQEGIRAASNCKALDIPHYMVSLPFIHQHFKSNLLSGQDEIPEGHYEEQSMKKTVVPFRNGIMLSIAAGIAESNGLKYIAIANHDGDHAIYPDCREEFIEAMAMAIGTGMDVGITIFSPFTMNKKREIALLGQKIGVDFNQTYSCYKGGETHCGRCGTCVERKEALEGFDPTTYEDPDFKPEKK